MTALLNRQGAEAAVERQRLTEVLARQATSQAALARIGEMALFTSDIDEFVQHVAATVKEVLAVPHSVVLTHQPDSSALRLHALAGVSPDLLRGLSPEAGDGGLEREALDQDAPVTVVDWVESGVRRSRLVEALRPQSSAAVGIRTGRGEFGVLEVHSGDRRVFAADELQFLRAAAQIVAVAVEHAHDEAASRATEAELERAWRETLERLARVVEYRDTETGDHTLRMAEGCERIALALGLDEERCEAIRLAAPMHDAGKVAIPDCILLKDGKLTLEERREMERHAERGHALLSGSGSALLDLAADIALTHHEWYDGSGYPRGLRGTQIPLEGRIAAVADVFDALTSDRPYRAAMSVAEAHDLMESERGTHFDPEVLDALTPDPLKRDAIPTSAGAKTMAGRQLPPFTSVTSSSFSEIPMISTPPALVSAASAALTRASSQSFARSDSAPL